MKWQLRFRMTAAVLILALLAGVVPLTADANGGTVVASEAEQRILQTPSIGSVNIAGGSSIELKQAYLLTSEQGNLVSFVLTLHNKSNQEIQFIDYWVRLLSSSGTSYTVQVLAQDKDKNRVAANSSMDINLYALVGSDVALEDLIFRIVQWDFSLPSYERRLGDLRVSDQYSVVTPSDSARIITVSGTQLKMSVEQLELGQNSQFYLPTIRFQLENVGAKTAQLPDYQFALLTEEGLLYPLEAQESDTGSTSLHPRFSKRVELSGQLPLSVGSDNWQLVVTNQLEGGTSSMAFPVAFFALPDPGVIEADAVVEVGEVRTIEVGTGRVESMVSQINRTSRDTSYAVSLTFQLKNVGSGSVSLPAYRFLIETSGGLTYPVAADALRDMVIDPLFEKQAQLTATIPSSVGSEGWKLLMLPPGDDSQSTTSQSALVVYELSDTSTEQGVLGRSYTFTNQDGSYTAVLNTIQRLPWEDQDIVSANLTITNQGSTALPVPAFNGYFLLDDIVLMEANAIVKDKVISIGANGGSINLQLYGKIPYTNEYSSLKLVLQEGADSTAATDLLEFRTSSRITALPTVAFGDSLDVTGVGRQTRISVRDAGIYEYDDSNLYSVRLLVQNLERRHSSLGSYVAYVQTSTDTIYPATISEVNSRIIPNGIAVLNVAAYLPASESTSGLRLILGSGVRDGNLIESGEPDAYIDAVQLRLPTERSVVKAHPGNLDLYPYSYSITQIRADTNVDSFTLNFHYRFTKSQLAEANMDRHRIVVEIEDKDQNLKLSRSFAITGTGADSLQLGEGTFSIEGPNQPAWYLSADSYTLRVYDEVDGYRKLLSETSVRYFGTYFLPVQP